MLDETEKKDFAAKLVKVKEHADKMLIVLDKEEWEQLVDLGNEMDAQMDVLYDHLTKVMIDMGYGEK